MVILFEAVQNGYALNTEIYTQQQQRMYDSLKLRYRAWANRKRALLQYLNIPAHTTNVTKCKLEELEWLEVLPQPSYSPNFA